MHGLRMWIAIGVAVFVAVTTSCAKNDHNVLGGGSGTVRMSITDDPAAVDAVHLVVTEVAVHNASPDSTGGWEVLRSDSSSFDLIQLQNGRLAPLASSLIPAGHYTQIRLKLGAGSTVTVDGITHPLVVPSGMQSGFKILSGFNVVSGDTTGLILDFDASRSIVLTGNGTYMLNPVVRVQVASSAGSITGHVLPDTVSTQVWAILNADSVAHATTGSDGVFTIAALPSGTYRVALHPSLGFRDTTIGNVTVAPDHVTGLGDIQLTPTGQVALPVSASLRRR